MKKPLFDFISLSVSAKIAFYRNVIAKMTGNANFTTPDKSLADLIALVNKLEADYIAAKDGGHTPTANMHKSEAAADAAFRLIVLYVDRIAQGDEAKILSSGLHVSKDRAAVNKPDLSAMDGAISGSVHLVAKAIPDAGAYIWQQTLVDKPTEWTIAGHSTQAVIDITGLPLGAHLQFRVAAITPDGVGNYCNPVLKVIA